MFASHPSLINYEDGRDVSDHVHQIASEAGSIVPRCDFDYASLDPPAEHQIPLETVTAGFCEILAWITGANDFIGCGARAHSLATLLDPINSRHRNLSAIARASGVHRATLNKSLHNLLDSYSIGLSVGKLQGAREKYREAQLSAVARGTHSSRFTRKSTGASAPQPVVPAMKLTDKPKTLSKAIDALEESHAQIERLKQQLASRPSQVSGNTGARSSPTPQTAQTKTPAATPLKVTDLSNAEIAEAMDICNHKHDTETLAFLYRELNARRRPI
jgi:hypothetical protein